MTFARVLFVLAGFLTLSACATPWQVAEVQDIKTAVATGGTAFTRALLDGYKEQARVESEVEFEWRHAVIFARKGARAATGEPVPPEDPSRWDIPAPALPALAEAYARLMADFADGARERVPALAAKAQVSFDCWLEEEWEGDSDTECRDAFHAAEAGLKPPAPPTPAAADPARTFVVYFDFDKTAVTAQAKAIIAAAARSGDDRHARVIHVSGFTDTVGTRRYNHKLSIKRAQAVAKALAEAGIAPAMLDVRGYGKSRPAVPTGDNIREPRNRRVEIVIDSGRAAATPDKVSHGSSEEAAPATGADVGAGGGEIGKDVVDRHILPRRFDPGGTISYLAGFGGGGHG